MLKKPCCLTVLVYYYTENYDIRVVKEVDIIYFMFRTKFKGHPRSKPLLFSIAYHNSYGSIDYHKIIRVDILLLRTILNTNKQREIIIFTNAVAVCLYVNNSDYKLKRFKHTFLV